MHAASRRLRLRFFSGDVASVSAILAGTKHTSQSDAIRAAVTLYQQAWSSRRMGFRVVFYRHGADEYPDAFDVSNKRAVTTSGKRAKTENSIEMRVTPSDLERIESLVNMQAADTSSDAVRRGVRLYATTLEQRREGWELVAISPSGDILPLQIAGMGGPPSDLSTAKKDSDSGLVFHLPRSLKSMIGELAAWEGCEPDVLMADLVRTEAQARMEQMADGAEPPAIQAAPPCVEPEVAQPVSAPDTAPDAAADTAADTAAWEDAEKALDKSARLLDDLYRLVGTEPSAQGQQAQLTDLFFSDEVGMQMFEGTAADATPGERVLGQINYINGRMAALAAIVPLRERPKSRRSAKAAAATAKEDWRTVLAADADGNPQQQVVPSKTIIPVAEEDLE